MTRFHETAPRTKSKPGPWARQKRREERAAAGLPPPSGLPVVAQPAPPPQTLSELGAPPSDPLAANAWAHRMVLLAMADAATDQHLSPRERRKELRTLGASAAKLIPHARLHEAEEYIRNARAEVAAKQSEKRKAVLEKRPPRVKPGGAS